MLATQRGSTTEVSEPSMDAPDPAKLRLVLVEPIVASLPDRRLLLANDDYRITSVRNTRELSLLSTAETFALALISDTLGRVELIDAAQSVRKRWPTACILVLGRASVVLEDYLYDEVLPHTCGQQDLCDILTRISSQHTHGRPFLVTTPASERETLQRENLSSGDISRLPDVPERMTQLRSR